jgi:Mn2+/Fe2+ NRAMP family transporter
VRRHPGKVLRSLGPGLVAGASDVDPTTVATMSVAGATTVFSLSWLVVLLLPMLASVQVIASQVGVAAKAGLQEVVRKRFGRRWGLLLLVSVLAVNLITIGADLGGGAAAAGLLLNTPARWLGIPYAILLLGLLIFGTYDEVQRVFKYIVLAFAAYAAAAFMARPDWGAVLAATAIPRFSFKADYVQAMLAILGTTLTSYAYVWETEETKEEHKPRSELNVVRLDAGLGMVAAMAVFWFILIATGATLGTHHKQVATAEEAANALAPVAGPWARYLFGVGLLASSFIAVPVLAVVSGELICQEVGWKAGLSVRFSEAKPFYGLVAGALAIGVVISLLGVSPITLLFWASIAGGLGTPISLVLMLLAARDRQVMRGVSIGKPLLVAGWFTTAVVMAACAAFLYLQIFQG